MSRSCRSGREVRVKMPRVNQHKSPQVRPPPHGYVHKKILWAGQQALVRRYRCLRALGQESPVAALRGALRAALADRRVAVVCLADSRPLPAVDRKPLGDGPCFSLERTGGQGMARPLPPFPCLGFRCPHSGSLRHQLRPTACAALRRFGGLLAARRHPGVGWFAALKVLVGQQQTPVPVFLLPPGSRLKSNLF